MDEMRDRLKELLVDCQHNYDKEVVSAIAEQRPFKHETAFFADHLIANGVILPPCKVGDTVFMVGVITQQITTHKVVGINYSEDGLFLLTDSFTVVSVAQQLGKTVFLTREEAEKECVGK